MFDCHGPIEGLYYVQSNMAVQCYVGPHVLAMLLSAAAILLFSLGLPAAILWIGLTDPHITDSLILQFLFGEGRTGSC